MRHLTNIYGGICVFFDAAQRGGKLQDEGRIRCQGTNIGGGMVMRDLDILDYQRQVPNEVKITRFALCLPLNHKISTYSGLRP